MSKNFSEISDKTIAVAKELKDRESLSARGLQDGAVANIWQSSRKTIAVFNATHSGASAVSICGAPSSVGPDFVNINEETFCRMTDRVVFPTCKPQDLIGSRDRSCFDVESMSLLEDDDGEDDGTLKVKTNKPYQRQWRTEGHGWEEITY